ncbi:MAG: signal recognition particle-docking protein FtsY [Microcoleaceae cyanobacterium]
MVFNWFRRQYDTDKEPGKETAKESSPSTPPASAQPSVPVNSQSLQPKTAPSDPPTDSASPEDYLKWAKAAYQNIQKQQHGPEKTEVEKTEVEKTESASQLPLAEMVEVTLEAAEFSPESLVNEHPEIESEVSEVPKSSSENVAEPITLAEPPKREIAVVPTPSQTPVKATAANSLKEAPDLEPASDSGATLPFWAKAEAERQARIERLKETAIAAPEPDLKIKTPEIPEPFPNRPDVVFDERFLWSAEVLASQGRRPDEVSAEEITWLGKLWQGLGRTRRTLLNQLKAIVGQGPLNQAAIEEIEALLLQADVGVEATDTIVAALQERLRQEALPPEQAIAYLKQILRDILEKPYQNGYSPTFAPEKETLNIWLITGVNGAGKTTTIGKIAHLASKSDYRCLIGAADTFRAAAVEQVKVWGQRSGVDVIANPGQNTDPAAVVFDAIEAAKSRNAELLLLDTAGRLQNKKNLMEELSKVRRVIDKKAPDALIESLLVLDSTLGQNGLRQAEVFAEVAQLSGVILTKLDGTAKGGVALAVVQQLGLPIRFIGVGESIEDLRPFSSYEFIEALLSG